MREQLTKRIALLRNPEAANAGSPWGCLPGILDLLSVAIAAYENDHSLGEELDLQAEAEAKDAAERGVHKLISCFGSFCTVEEIDENGNRIATDDGMPGGWM